MKKEAKIAGNKIYKLPMFTVVKHKNAFLAIASSLARWLVLKNEIQLDIFNRFLARQTVEEIFAKYAENTNDIIEIMTQLEATHIETLSPKSIFSNRRLHLHLTNRCNLRCSHCYMSSGESVENELSTAEIKTLCRNFASIGGQLVSLTGGEPTMHNDFIEIAEYISALGLNICIFSNGILWTDDMIKRLSILRLEGIQISIDGYDEKSNSIIRGAGAYAKAFKTIDSLVKHNIPVKIAVTPPYSLLKTDLNNYIVWCKKILDDYPKNSVNINFSYSLMPGRNLQPSALKKIKEDYFGRIEQIVNAVYGDTSAEDFVTNIADCILDSCGYGGLNVMANGDFFFCDRITDIEKSGNIREISFNEIVNKMKIAEQIGKIDNFMPCANCELKYICGGGCRIDNFDNFSRITDIMNINFSEIKQVHCNAAKKEKFYSLMLETYEKFFR